MANLKISLEGEDVIDNASIYLEDPQESIEYSLDPESDTVWTRTVTIPLDGDLEYSLYVVAFSGTRFKCTIEDTETGDQLEFKGITGGQVRNRAHIKGHQQLKP